MRIRLLQLRRIIKEEVKRTLNETEEPLRVAAARPRSDKFKALRSALGPTEYKRLFLLPQERYGEVSRRGEPELQTPAMDAFWSGVKPAFAALASALAAAPQEDLVSFPEYAALEDAVEEFDAAYARWLPSAQAASRAGSRGSVPRSAPMSAAEERNATMGYGGTDNPSYRHNDQW